MKKLDAVEVALASTKLIQDGARERIQICGRVKNVADKAIALLGVTFYFRDADKQRLFDQTRYEVY